MPTHVALLRAVNVAGKNLLRMENLRSLAENLGLSDVSTLLQSGNLLFTMNRSGSKGGRSPESAMESSLEEATRKRLRVDTTFLIRSADRWEKLVRANPFPDEARSDPARLHLWCMKGPAARGGEDALRAAIRGREEIAVKGDAAWLVYPDGAGRSKLTAALIERHLGVGGTARNWNTVLRIADALQQ